MKRVLAILAMTLCVITMFGQKDVTTFLGIPVDGYKSEMRKKLISKGFAAKTVAGQEHFEGEFNGTDVNVYIGTNNNKVYRIMLCDQKTRNETEIKIRFNKLVGQFERNERYTSLKDYTIPDDEDISYEMLVKDKRYEALFYQKPDMDKMDTLAVQNQIKQELLKKYTEEQLQNSNEDMQKEIKEAAIEIGLGMIFKKPVWFCISKNYGNYYITMFYDNEYNHADGEDL